MAFDKAVCREGQEVSANDRFLETQDEGTVINRMTQLLALLGCLYLSNPICLSAEVTNSVSINPDPNFRNMILVQQIIEIVGPITIGDANRIKQAYISNIQERDKKIGNRQNVAKHNLIYLSSGGGLISEALTIAGFLKEIEGSGPLIVAVKNVCASACTIILFSSEFRAARLCDLIGVHRASLLGGETPDTYTTTTEIADYLMKQNVPWGVVRKMLLTEASTVAWLTLDDMKMAGLHLLPIPCRQNMAA